MRLRTLLVIVVMLLVAVFVAVNWSAVTAPTTLSLLFMTIEAPVGLVMLGLLLLCVLAFLAYMAVWQSTTLIESRRHTKELHEQRVLADQAEASRFTELRGVIQSEIERLAAQIASVQAAMQTEVREQSNGLAAALAEFDDRLRRGGASL